MQDRTRKWKRFWIGFFLCLGAGLSLVGDQARQSNLFVLKKIEIQDLPAGSGISAEEVHELMGVRDEGDQRQNPLLSLSLDDVDLRLRTHPWVKRTVLRKILPDTLQVKIIPKKAVAIGPQVGGALSYIDDEGQLFGTVHSNRSLDLPYVSRMEASELQGVIEILKKWKDLRLDWSAEIASISFEKSIGYSAWILYPINENLVRTRVLFGQKIDEDFQDRLTRLGSVLDYLIRKRVAAKQIWNESVKKVVVKRAEPS